MLGLYAALKCYGIMTRPPSWHVIGGVSTASRLIISALAAWYPMPGRAVIRVVVIPSSSAVASRAGQLSLLSYCGSRFVGLRRCCIGPRRALAFSESQFPLHFLLAIDGGVEYNTEASVMTAQGWPSWQQSGDSIDLGAGVDCRDALVVAAYLTDKPKQGEDLWPTK